MPYVTNKVTRFQHLAITVSARKRPGKWKLISELPPGAEKPVTLEPYDYIHIQQLKRSTKVWGRK